MTTTMLYYTLLLILVAAVLVAGAVLLHAYLNGGPIGAALFKPKPERRLAVMEQASVDNRRRLILVRRDNVEHLIMTGGPVDVVIETGIGMAKPRTVVTDVVEAAPVFARAPRTKGQAVNE